MLSTHERIENLKKFKTIHLEDLKLNNNNLSLGFNPSLGLFRVISKNDKDSGHAVFAVTVSDLNKPTKKTLSKYDRGERLVEEIRIAWRKISKKKRNEFIDKIPLNSFFLGGDSIY